MNNNLLIGASSIINSIAVPSNVTGTISSRPQTLSSIVDLDLADPGILHWAVHPTATTQRTKAQILAGTGALNFGSFQTYVSGVHSVQAVNLSANTAYRTHYYIVRTSDSAESDADLTAEFTTYDQINAVNGVPFYLDGKDNTTKDDVAKTWTNKALFGGSFGQTIVDEQPDFSNANFVTFDNGDALVGGEIAVSNQGFNIWFCIDRDLTGADDYVIGGSNQLRNIQILVRNTTCLFQIKGATGATFSISLGVGVRLIRISFDGLVYRLFDETLTQFTPLVAPTVINSPYVFDKIGAAETVGQRMGGDIYAIAVYNGTEAATITYIQNKLQAKFVDNTETETTNAINTINSELFMLGGDSMAVGRDGLSNLTGGNTALNRLYPRSRYYHPSDGYVTYNPNTLYANENAADHFGPELALLNALETQSTVYGICLKFAIGGSFLDDTGAVTDWRSDLADESYFKAVRAWNSGVQFTNERLFSISKTKLILRLLTNDAVDVTASGNAGTNVDNIVTAFRNDVLANIEVLMFEITSGTNLVTVNNQLSVRDRNSGNAASIPGFEYSTASNGLTLIDGVHENADGLVVVGEAAYQWFKIDFFNLQAYVTQFSNAFTWNWGIAENLKDSGGTMSIDDGEGAHSIEPTNGGVVLPFTGTTTHTPIPNARLSQPPTYLADYGGVWHSNNSNQRYNVVLPQTSTTATRVTVFRGGSTNPQEAWYAAVTGGLHCAADGASYQRLELGVTGGTLANTPDGVGYYDGLGNNGDSLDLLVDVLVKDGTSISLYRNGTLLHSGLISNDTVSVHHEGSNGHRENMLTLFSATIIGTALSAPQVTELMTEAEKDYTVGTLQSGIPQPKYTLTYDDATEEVVLAWTVANHTIPHDLRFQGFGYGSGGSADLNNTVLLTGPDAEITIVNNTNASGTQRIPSQNITEFRVNEIGFTADPGTNRCTVTSIGGSEVFGENEDIAVYNEGGALPEPLVANTRYFIEDLQLAGASLAVGDTFLLSSTSGGGNVIDITTAGTGTQFIRRRSLVHYMWGVAAIYNEGTQQSIEVQRTLGGIVRDNID